MIDEIIVDALNSAYWHGELKNKDGVLAPVLKEALTAIYEIGLECIGADERGTPIPDVYRTRDELNDYYKSRASRDDLRASQRKAWAKACGVAE